MTTLLLLLLILPLVGAVAAALLGAQRPDAVRWVSLAATVLTLAASVVIAAGYMNLPVHSHAATFQPEFVPGSPFIHADTLKEDAHATTWNLLKLRQGTAVQFYIGVDGLNLWLVVLTALLMVAAVLGSWTSVKERDNEFFAWLLALEVAMIGVFLAFDILLFYVFFELTLVPLFFLIGIWGGPQRQYAARKFFIYTLAGSLITLLGVLGAVLAVANDPYVEPARPGFTPPPNAVNELTFSIPRLVELVHGHTADLPQEVTAKGRAAGMADEFDLKRDQEQLRRAQDRLAFWRWVEFWVFAAMMVGFAVKVPLFPVHTWLPLAHVEAPTAGSVLLAGVLLKIGVYGFLRLCIPLAPDASLSLGTPLIGWLGVVGVLYGSFCALAQDDIKKLVAYSSVAHLGYCMIGLFALNEIGLAGGVLQMINHGLSTGALFLLVGMLYERYHTRKMADYSGMAARLKWMAVFWVFITMSSIGLPGLNGFVSETLTMMGMYAFQRPEVPGWLLSGLATGGILIGAWYMLMLLRRVFFGELREPAHEGHGRVADLNGREWLALAPLAALCLFLGVWSQPFLNSVKPDLQIVTGITAAAKERADAGWNAPLVASTSAAPSVALSGENAP
jgi:NADH-quinone oxidoreductase subunit M